jgi:hypothetical protein
MAVSVPPKTVLVAAWLAFLVAAWLACGILSYGGQMAHEKIDPDPDRLCREVHSAAICDDRLRQDESFLLIWSVLGGPASLLVTATVTGFFHAGFAWSRV